MKLFFDSVGCRLNQAEIERMALDFRSAGHEIVDDMAEAEIVVVNTCAVTAAAASDSRQKIRQVNRMGVPQIVATGCWVSLDPQAAREMTGVTQVILNNEKSQLASLVIGKQVAAFELEPLERTPLPGIHRRTRAFIKVQDGCNNHCTFCVTRIARGASISVPEKEILNEVLSAEKGGAQEIVLSGVHLASWGHDFQSPLSLSDLLLFLLKETGIPRIRLSSIEPWDLDEAFFDLWQNPRLCPHFHLPLQSGSEATLRRMSRHTTPDLYRKLVQLIRRNLPEAAITTDIIVGFPGETEAEFTESLAFVKEMSFSGGHVFKYSAREGTPAFKLPGRINGQTARQRSQAMRSILAQSQIEYEQRFYDRRLDVLWESVSHNGDKGWLMHGLSQNYLTVCAWSEQNIWNTISPVKICRIDQGTLEGELLPDIMRVEKK
jgi:threonylcarbamoyladenosine tRNA methylthiotransferase MtaB